MCVIACGSRHTLTRAKPLKEILGNMARQNPDGYGALLTFPDGTYVLYKDSDSKAILTNQAFFDDWEKADNCYLHFRYATHGAVNFENCHPFDVGNNRWLFHNGIITGLGSKDVSDSGTLAALMKDLPLEAQKAMLIVVTKCGHNNGKFLLVDATTSEDWYFGGEGVKKYGFICSNGTWDYTYAPSKTYAYSEDWKKGMVSYVNSHGNTCWRRKTKQEEEEEELLAEINREEAAAEAALILEGEDDRNTLTIVHPKQKMDA